MSAFGRRWWLAVSVAIVLVAASGTAVSEAGSRRRGVAVEKLILGPSTLWGDPAQGARWTDFARRTGGRESVREWAGPSGSLLHEEASEHRGGSFGGRYYYASADPAGRYGKKYPGLVRSAESPSGIGADAAKLFCGNTGKSAPGDFGDCQIWGYWARYGQYVAYLEVTDLRLARSDFTALAQRFDAAMAASLPR